MFIARNNCPEYTTLISDDEDDIEDIKKSKKRKRFTIDSESSDSDFVVTVQKPIQVDSQPIEELIDISSNSSFYFEDSNHSFSTPLTKEKPTKRQTQNFTVRTISQTKMTHYFSQSSQSDSGMYSDSFFSESSNPTILPTETKVSQSQSLSFVSLSDLYRDIDIQELSNKPILNIKKFNNLSTVSELKNNNENKIKTTIDPYSFPLPSVSQLCIGPRKVKEFNEWINTVINLKPGENPSFPRLCILKGPSGTGKRTMLQSCCHDSHIYIHEYSNRKLYTYNDNYIQGSSSINDLYRFLISSSTSLLVLFLLDELPATILAPFSTFNKDIDAFRLILSTYIQSKPLFPVVILWDTDEDSSGSNYMNLFRSLQNDGGIYICETKNVTEAKIKIALKRLISFYPRGDQSTLSSSIPSICTDCNGNLRSAANMLYLNYIHGGTQLGATDSSYTAVHIYGKILHIKSDLPRESVSLSPDLLASIDITTAISWISTNIPFFSSDIDDISAVMEDLSMIDCLSHENGKSNSSSKTICELERFICVNTCYRNNNHYIRGYRPLVSPSSYIYSSSNNRGNKAYSKSLTGRDKQGTWNALCSMCEYILKHNQTISLYSNTTPKLLTLYILPSLFNSINFTSRQYLLERYKDIYIDPYIYMDNEFEEDPIEED
ncbi:hypothetical protein WA158_000689 [Blastocystis sp. Blastoise]